MPKFRSSYCATIMRLVRKQKMFLRPGTITGYTPLNSNYLNVSSSAGGESFPAVCHNSTGWCTMGHTSISYCAFVFSIFLLVCHSFNKLMQLCPFLSSTPSFLPDNMSGFMQNVGCSDGDWASDALDRKSISGYSFFFEGSLVSWSAAKQKSIALSSTEAE